MESVSTRIWAEAEGAATANATARKAVIGLAFIFVWFLGCSFSGQLKLPTAGFAAAKLGGRQVFVKQKRTSGLSFFPFALLLCAFA